MASAPVPPIDDLPGYRRRFIVTPGEGRVLAELEDDYHHMRVAIEHDGAMATAVRPEMVRWPWTTCPGAEARLAETFTGVPLAGFAARGEKTLNCTHLHDLATLAAAHSADAAPTVYDVLVSDPVDGASRAELRRDGAAVLAWELRGFTITAPADVAGIDLFRLKPLLEQLDEAGQEAVRVLRWGIIVGSGRAIPLDRQSDASSIPPNCHTFQPENAAHTVRIGRIRDFPAEGAEPLDIAGAVKK